MKVSEWLRKYQISGKVPNEVEDPRMSFWCGWLIGMASRKIDVVESLDDARDIAIRAAEFIESQARE